MGKQDAVGVWTSEREPRLARLGESIGDGDGTDGAELGLLFTALASEFQGFSRDLHDETAMAAGPAGGTREISTVAERVG